MKVFFLVIIISFVQLIFSQEKKDSSITFNRVFGSSPSRDSLISLEDSVLYFLMAKHKMLVAFDLKNKKIIWQNNLQTKLKLNDKEFAGNIEYFGFLPERQIYRSDSWKQQLIKLKRKHFIIQFYNKDFITVNAASGAIEQITERSKNGFLQRDTIKTAGKNSVIHLKDPFAEKKKVVSVKIGPAESFFKTALIKNVDFIFDEKSGELRIINESILIPGRVIETEWD